MHKLENLHVTEVRPLITPKDLKAELPRNEKADRTVFESRQIIEDILTKKDPRLLVITGPCSIHDIDQAVEYAKRLKDLKDKLEDKLFIVMRVYVDKPRTTVGWRGFIHDPEMKYQSDFNLGLRKTREVMLKVNELGIPVATELLDPFVPQYIADLLVWGAIGARTTESQTHRTMASGVSIPVGFKNSTDGNVKVAIDAIIAAQNRHTFLGIDEHGQAAMIGTEGNPYGHVILRGGRSGANYSAQHVQEAAREMREAGLNPAIVVDCSHANSNKDFRKQSIAWNEVIEQRMAGDRDLVGVMLESHLNEGAQKIPSDLSQLKYGVSVTDACISWEATEDLLTSAHQMLSRDVVQK